MFFILLFTVFRLPTLRHFNLLLCSKSQTDSGKINISFCRRDSFDCYAYPGATFNIVSPPSEIGKLRRNISAPYSSHNVVHTIDYHRYTNVVYIDKSEQTIIIIMIINNYVIFKSVKTYYSNKI